MGSSKDIKSRGRTREPRRKRLIPCRSENKRLSLLHVEESADGLLMNRKSEEDRTVSMVMVIKAANERPRDIDRR